MKIEIDLNDSLESIVAQVTKLKQEQEITFTTSSDRTFSAKFYDFYVVLYCKMQIVKSKTDIGSFRKKDIDNFIVFLRKVQSHME